MRNGNLTLKQVCIALIPIGLLSACANYDGAKQELNRAALSGQIMDSSMIAQWSRSGISDKDRNPWINSWRFRQTEWHAQWDTAKTACDSGQNWRWDIVSRHRFLNKCSDYGTVLQTRAEAMQVWSAYVFELQKLGDTNALKSGPYALGWLAPQDCKSLNTWISKIPKQLRFDQDSVLHQVRMADHPIWQWQSSHLDWANSWIFVNQGCQRGFPSQDWVDIEKHSWLWWALATAWLTDSLKQQVNDNKVENLNHQAQSEIENTLAESTKLSKCQSDLEIQGTKSHLDSLIFKKAISDSAKIHQQQASLLKILSDPYEHLRHFSATDFAIAPMDPERKVLRLAIADTLFNGDTSTKTSLNFQLGRVAGALLLAGDRPVYIADCDGNTSLGRKAQLVQKTLFLLGLDDAQCLKSSEIKADKHIEIFVKPN